MTDEVKKYSPEDVNSFLQELDAPMIQGDVKTESQAATESNDGPNGEESNDEKPEVPNDVKLEEIPEGTAKVESKVNNDGEIFTNWLNTASKDELIDLLNKFVRSHVYKFDVDQIVERIIKNQKYFDSPQVFLNMSDSKAQIPSETLGILPSFIAENLRIIDTKHEANLTWKQTLMDLNQSADSENSDEQNSRAEDEKEAGQIKDFDAFMKLASSDEFSDVFIRTQLDALNLNPNKINDLLSKLNSGKLSPNEFHQQLTDHLYTLLVINQKAYPQYKKFVSRITGTEITETAEVHMPKSDKRTLANKAIKSFIKYVKRPKVLTENKVVKDEPKLEEKPEEKEEVLEIKPEEKPEEKEEVLEIKPEEKPEEKEEVLEIKPEEKPEEKEEVPEIKDEVKPEEKEEVLEIKPEKAREYSLPIDLMDRMKAFINAGDYDGLNSYLSMQIIKAADADEITFSKLRKALKIANNLKNQMNKKE